SSDDSGLDHDSAVQQTPNREQTDSTVIPHIVRQTSPDLVATDEQTGSVHVAANAPAEPSARRANQTTLASAASPPATSRQPSPADGQRIEPLEGTDPNTPASSPAESGTTTPGTEQRAAGRPAAPANTGINHTSVEPGHARGADNGAEYATRAIAPHADRRVFD